MKITIPAITTAAGLLMLSLGCNRQSDTSSATAGQNVSATSRDRNAASRAYADTNTAHDADNTGRNVRDRSDEALTAQDQAATASDREIARRIRRDLTSNDQFSTTAKNIKIISTNGKVTLRGPVKTDQERQAIADLAQKVAGVTELDNQLETKRGGQ
jgi:osmotically-inducible protein OsmY